MSVSVEDLNIQQLAEVKRQLDEVYSLLLVLRHHSSNQRSRIQELTHLTNSFTQLKAAQSKFKTCVDNVAEVKPANKGACIAHPHRQVFLTLRTLSARQNDSGPLDQLTLYSWQAF